MPSEIKLILNGYCSTLVEMVHINSNLTGYGPWPLPDIILFSRLHTNLIGTSDLASLFLHRGCFCLAYQSFFCHIYIATARQKFAE